MPAHTTPVPLYMRPKVLWAEDRSLNELDFMEVPASTLSQAKTLGVL